jgi:hypothetical protein
MSFVLSLNYVFLQLVLMKVEVNLTVLFFRTVGHPKSCTLNTWAVVTLDKKQWQEERTDAEGCCKVNCVFITIPSVWLCMKVIIC